MDARRPRPGGFGHLLRSPLLLVCSLLLVMEIRGDGYFPFPKTWPPDRLLLLVLPHTLALAAGVIWAAHLLLSDRIFLGACVRPRVHYVLYTIGPLACIAFVVGLHLLQADYFRYAGYGKDVPGFLLIACVSLVPLTLYWSRAWATGRRRLRPFLLCVFASSFVLKIIPLVYFPVTALRSDLLPIVREGALSILRWDNPIATICSTTGF